MKHYDYIFTGAGLSSLMTVYQMVKSEKFTNKTILLIDEDSKKSNDRTWSYWEKEKGSWDKILWQNWNKAVFRSENSERTLDLEPYKYKTVRGIDFYKKVFKKIASSDTIKFINQRVIGFTESANGVVIQTEDENFSCTKLFNSIYSSELALNQNKYPFLSQHFIGWFVKTEKPSFDPNSVIFMDFSIEQKGNTRFMYVLPVSNTEALIEYTLFSKELLLENEYEEAIKKYIKNLGISSYEILEKERGNIPMTSYKFWKHNTKNILNIGSAGGWTKASTGYTFKNSDKKSKELVAFLQSESDLTKFHKTDKFWFYDLLLLDILNRNNEKGAQIFSSMFKNGNPSLIFKFLDEETTFWEDLKVIWKCPKRLFIKSLFLRLF